MKKLLFCLIAIFVILFCFSPHAGAFDDNDYDGGWDSDYDSSDYDSGYDGSSGGSGGFSPYIFVIMLFIMIVFQRVSTMLKKSGKSGGSQGNVRRSSNQGMSITLPDRTGEIEDIIKEHDPNFSANDFISFVKRMYIDIQTAWCKRDMVPVRAFLHDNLYDATVRQVQSKIDQGVVYHYESMVVNTTYLSSYTKDEQFEYLGLYVNARMIDWQEDEKTGKVLRGDKTTRWDLRYKMKYVRSLGVKTKEETSETTSHNCPNCGAPLEIASSGKCTYCGTVITTGQYSWVLSDFGTIRNDTIDEGVKK